MDSPFVVLIVCQANVCRSPLAAFLMATAVGRAGLSTLIDVRSTGTHAVPGMPQCQAALDWSGGPGSGTGSVPVTGDALRESDLILVADRENRAECARLAPECRPRLFTLNQAAFLAASLGEELNAGAAPDGAPPPPEEPSARLRWLVGEMDAARGRLAGRDGADDDIVDRHGPEPHVDAFEEVDAAVGRIASLLAACAA